MTLDTPLSELDDAALKRRMEALKEIQAECCKAMDKINKERKRQSGRREGRVMIEECKLCGGLGEVTITPYGAPDWDADIYGCHCCIERERNEDEVKLKARIAELERQLAESRDFAVSEAAKIRTAYERQQAVLIEELRQIEHSMNQAKVPCIELPPAKKGGE